MEARIIATALGCQAPRLRHPEPLCCYPSQRLQPKDRALERPIIAQSGGVHFVDIGPSVKEATEDAASRAVDFTLARTDLDREQAYALEHHR